MRREVRIVKPADLLREAIELAEEAFPEAKEEVSSWGQMIQLAEGNETLIRGLWREFYQWISKLYDDAEDEIDSDDDRFEAFENLLTRLQAVPLMFLWQEAKKVVNEIPFDTGLGYSGSYTIVETVKFWADEGVPIAQVETLMPDLVEASLRCLSETFFSSGSLYVMAYILAHYHAGEKWDEWFQKIARCLDDPNYETIWDMSEKWRTALQEVALPSIRRFSSEEFTEWLVAVARGFKEGSGLSTLYTLPGNFVGPVRDLVNGLLDEFKICGSVLREMSCDDRLAVAEFLFRMNIPFNVSDVVSVSDLAVLATMAHGGDVVATLLLQALLEDSNKGVTL